MKTKTNIGIIDIKIEDIMEMPSESLVEKFVEYSEEYNIDITYLADLFDNNKALKEMLYSDCVINNVIKDEPLKKILEEKIKDDWE